MALKKITIVGNGFSAALAKLKLKEHNLEIISPKNSKSLNTHFKRRRSIETNKAFSKKAFSFGELDYVLGTLKLHDRISVGGNTNIWGGMIDTHFLTQEAFNLLHINKILLKNINLLNSGYKTNRHSIRQLCNSSGEILDTSTFFENEENKFLHSIEIKNNKIGLKVFLGDENRFYYSTTDKLILAIGFPQLLDLLFRSRLLERNIKIQLDEFNHRFQISFKKNIACHDPNEVTVVQFSFFKAIDHYLGSNFFFNKFNFMMSPVYVNQIFSYEKRIIELELNCQKRLIYNKSKSISGDSAHYCNMRIGGVPIDTYLKSISTNLCGVSMPFVRQKRPGPISSDIMLKVLKIDI